MYFPHSAYSYIRRFGDYPFWRITRFYHIMKKRNPLKICFIILACIVLALSAFSGVKYFSGYESFYNVQYANKPDNVMDIFIPSRAYTRENNGCVLFIHGGSWSGGDKQEEEARCRFLASHGYITATINYTLWSEETADTYHVFNVLHEIDAALTTLREFAASRSIRIDKAATAGYSAGAHLAMLYAFSRSDISPLPIAFTASMAGPADLSANVWGAEMSQRIIKRLTGEDVDEQTLLSGGADELIASLSPVSYICENSPPALLMQGGKDTVVPPANAQAIADKLTQCAIPHDYVYLKDSDHSLIQNPIQHLEYFKRLLNYCQTYFY